MNATAVLIMAVNIAVNRKIQYKPDAVDHWQSPAETARLGTGDCEDYAIAKYFELRKNGVPDSEMWLVYTLDAGGHMTLQAGGVVLDNRSDAPIPAAQIEPVYTFNASGMHFNGKIYDYSTRLPQWAMIVSEERP